MLRKRHLSDAFVLLQNRYQTKHSDVSSESIKTFKYFVRCIAFKVKSQYNDFWVCMSTVVQIYKNFTDDWQWKDYLKIADKVTLLTLNVSCQWIFTDLTIRLLSLMTSSISSMSYNWNLNLLKESEKDAMPLWYTLFILIHSYEKMTKTSTKDQKSK